MKPKTTWLDVDPSFKILPLLDGKDGLTQKEIANQMNVSEATVSYYVRNLINLILVMTKRDKAGNRVYLTPEGKKFYIDKIREKPKTQEPIILDYYILDQLATNVLSHEYSETNRRFFAEQLVNLLDDGGWIVLQNKRYLEKYGEKVVEIFIDMVDNPQNYQYQVISALFNGFFYCIDRLFSITDNCYEYRMKEQENVRAWINNTFPDKLSSFIIKDQDNHFSKGNWHDLYDECIKIIYTIVKSGNKLSSIGMQMRDLYFSSNLKRNHRPHNNVKHLFVSYILTTDIEGKPTINMEYLFPDIDTSKINKNEEMEYIFNNLLPKRTKNNSKVDEGVNEEEIRAQELIEIIIQKRTLLKGE